MFLDGGGTLTDEQSMSINVYFSFVCFSWYLSRYSVISAKSWKFSFKTMKVVSCSSLSSLFAQRGRSLNLYWNQPVGTVVPPQVSIIQVPVLRLCRSCCSEVSVSFVMTDDWLVYNKV